MSNSKPRWVKWFPGDILGSVRFRELSDVAQGLYLLLLTVQAQRGYLSSDPERIRRSIGWVKETFDGAFSEVKELFSATKDGLENERMAELIAERERTYGRSSKGGKACAQARAKRAPRASSSSSTSSSSSKREDSDSRPAWERTVDELGLEGRGFDQPCRDWAAYRTEMRRPWKARTWKTHLRKWAKDPEGFAAAVEHSISQEYAGLFPAKNGYLQTSRKDAAWARAMKCLDLDKPDDPRRSDLEGPGPGTGSNWPRSG